MEDSQIIDMFFRREEEAIVRTSEAYGSRLYALAHRILEDREDSEETVSDTYLKAWQTIPPTRPSFFYAYLAKICRFAAFGRLDMRNAEKRKAEVVELSAEMELCIPDIRRQDEAEARELAQTLNAFLGTLKEDARRTFLRRYWFGDSIEQIAERYQISESKVKSQLFRTRNSLRSYLEKEGIAI